MCSLENLAPDKLRGSLQRALSSSHVTPASPEAQGDADHRCQVAASSTLGAQLLARCKHQSAARSPLPGKLYFYQTIVKADPDPLDV